MGDWTWRGRPIGRRTLPGYGDCSPPDDEPDPPEEQECACCGEGGLEDDMSEHRLGGWLCDDCAQDYDKCDWQSSDDCPSADGDEWVKKSKLTYVDASEAQCAACKAEEDG